MIDASALAAVAAIENLKIPSYEDGEVIREKYTTIKIREYPTYFTFAKINNKIICDPNQSEEIASDCRFTVCLGDDTIYAIQKGGPGAFKKDEIFSMIDIGLKKRKDFLNLIKSE
jgi:exosome complex RNA-binding protein Rrp42 (RNase PH superfamily)